MFQSTEEANIEKEKGNNFFRSQEYQKALERYQSALQYDPNCFVLYTNCAACFAALNMWSECATVASECISRSTEPIPKSYYWLAKAQLQLQDLSSAKRAIQKGIEIAPENKELLKLAHQVKQQLDQKKKPKKQSTDNSPPFDIEQVQSIRDEPRKPSVKEFDLLEQLGHGNFSQIVICKHKKTGEIFACKIIEKKEVDQVEKRHPNVHNEIQMEKRILAKLRGHPNIITLYHTFQDYLTLYFLMEYCEGGEVWSKMLEGDKRVGLYPSFARFYLAEVVSAVEYMHKHGIVHRDLKPENMVLTKTGHVKIVDFGTAKDLIETDLNGPEFVGTPEYMSPEMVRSKSAGVEADFWALGCILFQMLTGDSPFHSPSPYLCFLKTKRCLPLFPELVEDDAKDFILRFLRKIPSERLGSGSNGFHDIKSHSYWKNSIDWDRLAEGPAVRVPTLQELCIRSIKKTVEYVADQSPTLPATTPNSNSNLDMMRMNRKDRLSAMYYLNRVGKLAEPRIYRQFFSSGIDAKTLRCDYHTLRTLGMEYEEQKEYRNPFCFVYLTAPDLTNGTVDENAWEQPLRSIISKINRLRPKFILVDGVHVLANENNYVGKLEKMRKTFARVSETIPVLYIPGKIHDHEALVTYRRLFGADFYGFWFGGLRGLVVNSYLLANGDESINQEDYLKQKKWLLQELELGKLCANLLLLFSHTPLYMKTFDEPDDIQNDMNNNYPTNERYYWLKKFLYRKVHGVFSGHQILSKVNSILSLPKAIRQHKKDETTEQKENNTDHSSESDSESEKEEENAKKNKHNRDPTPLQCIITQEFKTCNNSEIRLVKVYERKFEHELFTEENFPVSITLAEEKLNH